jgi:two-component system chemotaxis response regulator CheY
LPLSIVMQKTILVVDDVAIIRKALVQILLKARYHVVGQAENGEQAVELYKKFQPNLVIMDVIMPVLNGIDALRSIIENDSQARVIIVSGLNREELIMDAIYAGALDYIVKPFNVDTILKAAERALLGEEYFLGKTVVTGLTSV